MCNPMAVVAVATVATAALSAKSSYDARKDQKKAVKKAEKQRAADKATIEAGRDKATKNTQAGLVRRAATAKQRSIAGGRRSTMLTDQNALEDPDIKGKTLLGG